MRICMKALICSAAHDGDGNMQLQQRESKQHSAKPSFAKLLFGFEGQTEHTSRWEMLLCRRRGQNKRQICPLLINTGTLAPKNASDDLQGQAAS